MKMHVDTQRILLDQTSYIGRFGHVCITPQRVIHNVWQLIVDDMNQNNELRTKL